VVLQALRERAQQVCDMVSVAREELKFEKVMYIKSPRSPTRFYLKEGRNQVRLRSCAGDVKEDSFILNLGFGFLRLLL